MKVKLIDRYGRLDFEAEVGDALPEVIQWRDHTYTLSSLGELPLYRAVNCLLLDYYADDPSAKPTDLSDEGTPC